MGSFVLTAKGPFSLEASRRFLEGFAPAGHEANDDGHLRFAFVPEDSREAVGVCLKPAGERKVIGEVVGNADPETVKEQVERILSLDVDGGGFPEVGERDPVVGRLQRRYPGLRPVGFFSPYEAAAWALIGHRVRITQAAKTKKRMAQQLGQEVVIDGGSFYAFPAPEELRELTGFPGLWEEKVRNLREMAEAAEEGHLHASRLRSLPAGEALDELKKLRGVGDFSAELILLRGAGEPDHLSTSEPRLRRAVAMAYGLDREPDRRELEEISDRWRPYRTWVTLLLRTMLEDETQEIGGKGR